MFNFFRNASKVIFIISFILSCIAVVILSVIGDMMSSEQYKVVSFIVAMLVGGIIVIILFSFWGTFLNMADEMHYTRVYLEKMYNPAPTDTRHSSIPVSNGNQYNNARSNNPFIKPDDNNRYNNPNVGDQNKNPRNPFA